MGVELVKGWQYTAHHEVDIARGIGGVGPVFSQRLANAIECMPMRRDAQPQVPIVGAAEGWIEHPYLIQYLARKKGSCGADWHIYQQAGQRLVLAVSQARQPIVIALRAYAPALLVDEVVV